MNARYLMLCMLIAMLYGCNGGNSVASREKEILEFIYSAERVEDVLPYLEYGWDHELLKDKMAQRSEKFGDPLWDHRFEYLNEISSAAYGKVWQLYREDKSSLLSIREAWLQACKEDGRPQTLVLLSPLWGRQTEESRLNDIRIILEEIVGHPTYSSFDYNDEFMASFVQHYDALLVACYRYLDELRNANQRSVSRDWKLDKKITEMLLQVIKTNDFGTNPATQVHVERMWRRIAAVTLELQYEPD